MKTQQPRSVHYRPDIDGLRAVAVLGVVFYHAGVQFVPGGFVGVDIFFVISGFLITSILLRETEEGVLSLKSFYERRIRRIVPALYVMLAAVWLYSIFWAMPWARLEMARSTKSIVLSISNIYFNSATGNYFGEMAESMPLLHTWSLGVEEQFYMVFPLLFFAAKRWQWSRRKLVCWIAALGGVSLAACLWRMRFDSSGCFYLSPYRAWELTLGALTAMWMAKHQVALHGRSKLATWGAHLAGLLGVGLIMVAMGCYDRHTPFPGLAALPPCLGAVLIIVAGGHGHHWAGRLLGLRPMVFIGLISYSVYLWHWPVLVFQSMFAIGQKDGEGSAHLWAGLLSLPLGALSWWLVERPFRNRKVTKRQVFIGWGVSSVIFLGLYGAAQATHGFDWGLPAQARQFLKAKKDTNPDQDRAFNHAPADAFVYGDTAKPPSLVLWGDSHADALAHEMGEMAKKHGASIRYYGLGSTPPLVGLHWCREGKVFSYDKSKYNDEVCRLIEGDTAIKGVILAARWALPVRGDGRHGTADSDVEKGFVPCLGRPDGSRFASVEEAQDAQDACVRITVARLRAAGKRVFLVYPIPEAGCDVPRTLAQLAVQGRGPENIKISVKNSFFKRQAAVMKTFDSLPDGPDLVRLKPHEILIDNGYLRVVQGDDVLYSDDNHLSLRGTRELKPLFEEVFTRMGSPEQTKSGQLR